MKKKILQAILTLNVVLMVVLIGYKVKSSIESYHFGNYNYQNVQKLNDIPSANYSFAVANGIQTNYATFRNREIPSINSNPDIKFVVANGNSVTEGGKSEYLALRNLTKAIDVPTLFGVGSNEVKNDGAHNYFEYLGNYYYSFSYGDSYFIFLDSTSSSDLDEQTSWFKNELINSQKYVNTFVFLNDSPLENNEASSITLTKEDELQNAFTENNIDYVFYNGTKLSEQRHDGVDYVSTGNSSVTHSIEKQGYYVINITGDKIALDYEELAPATDVSGVEFIKSVIACLASIENFQFFNVLLYLSITLCLLTYLYRKVSEPTNYYPDFKQDYEFQNERKLKIAMFTNNYLPFIGGVPISIQRLSEELEKMGHEVVIFAPEYPEEIEENNTIRIKLLHYVKRGNFNYAIANIFSKGYKKQFVAEDFDIVHVHHSFWLGTAGLNLARKHNIPVIFTYHTRLEFYSENIPIGKTAFKNYFSHEMVYKFAQKCDGVIAPTQSAFEYLENIKVGTPKIISPTGIDFSKYEEKPPIKGLRTCDDEVVLCTVSRLSVEKNIDFIIEGLSVLKRKTSTKFKCYIIGSGPAEAELKQQVIDLNLEDVIIFTGAVAPDEVVSYYMQSDIFIFASISETQGMVLLEAMAGHCPVVCINSSGVNDVVTNNYNGFKTNYDVDEWTQKLQLLIEDKDKRERFADNAYKYSQDFSKEIIAKNISTFYQKIISKKEINNEQR